MEEVDGNVEMNTNGGPGVKARNNRLKRKLASPNDESKTRGLARKLDFTKGPPGS